LLLQSAVPSIPFCNTVSRFPRHIPEYAVDTFQQQQPTEVHSVF